MVKSVLKFFTTLFESPKTTDYFSPDFKMKGKEGSESSFSQKVPKLYFRNFAISDFKGIKKVTLSFVKDDLVLLLGLNESGKTTILKGIEAFDFRNDPDKDTNPRYFTSIRRKSDVDFDGESVVTAEVVLESKLPTKYITQLDSSKKDIEQLQDFIKGINETKSIFISRVFTFKNGEPINFYYRFESEHEYAKLQSSFRVAAEIVKLCPHIIYFEDFKDRIPEKIYVNSSSDSYDPVWFDIIDGLFYNAKSSYSVEKFMTYYEDDGARDADAKTVLRQVNMELNKVFTKRWRSLSGVRQIADTNLEYNADKQYFQLKIYDKDGTNFSVDERSKGALWYLSFLMKTEFGSKKMRRNSGKPVYLIDEPASNLHSSAQTNMIKNFIKLVKDTSIIYTTHSQYLISLKSIKNTHVIQRDGKGTVNATKWSDFIKTSPPDVKYYQPLANLLNIVPTNFDIPWNRAVITEGPSDFHVLKLMYWVLYKKEPDFVIYPGTSATKLNTLISLNIGWNSKFKVLLDSDSVGKESGSRYQAEYLLGDELVYLPGDNTRIEDCFSDSEKKKLYNLAFGEEIRTRVSKKQFSSMFALLNEETDQRGKVSSLLEASTKSRFDQIFNSLFD